MNTNVNFKELKKVVFADNSSFQSVEGLDVYAFYEYLLSLSVDCVVVDYASRHKEKLFSELQDADALVFASTFIYEEEVRNVGNLLKNLKKPLLVFGQCVGTNRTLVGELENLWTVSELLEFSHHRVFELTGSFRHLKLFTEDELYKELDFNVYKQEVERLEKERLERNKGFRKTGRKVRVKQVQASGPEWSQLKAGDVVDELDCSSIDTSPSRGVWVMGVTEPVKLLNDSGYEEWEYETLTAVALTREFFSKGCYLHQKELLDIVTDWVKKCSVRLSESELWNWCDTLCETLNLERRNNRHFFESRLKLYRSKHTYFTE